MPEPIRPHPRTPTVRIAIIPSLTEAGRAGRARGAGGNGAPCPPSLPCPPFSPLYRFDHRRDPLATADAGGRQPSLQSAPAQFEEQREQQPRAAHPERVAEGDGAAVDV